MYISGTPLKFKASGSHRSVESGTQQNMNDHIWVRFNDCRLDNPPPPHPQLEATGPRSGVSICNYRCCITENRIQYIGCNPRVTIFLKIKKIFIKVHTFWEGHKILQKSRPCGFGQSLGRPIVRSISHFFWSTKEKFVQYQIFFVHSLEFFVQSFLKMWFWSVSWPTNCLVNFSFFEKDWTKNSREWTKKIWDWTNFFWLTKKNEK